MDKEKTLEERYKDIEKAVYAKHGQTITYCDKCDVKLVVPSLTYLKALNGIYCDSCKKANTAELKREWDKNNRNRKTSTRV